MNTIHKYEGWKPTYYVTVDHRVYREFGEEIGAQFADLPKFIPSPNLDAWQGENFVRWYHRPGAMSLSDIESGLAFDNCMQVTMQLAFFMGFTTLLIVGMEHEPDKGKAHFWGWDDGIRNPAPLALWFEGYRNLQTGMLAQGCRVLNISEGTHVPEEVIPRADWRTYESRND